VTPERQHCAVGSSDDQRAVLERNLQLIPFHIALSRSLVWISVMVLFTRHLRHR